MLVSLLKHAIKDGAIRIVDSRGRIHIVGDGSTPVCTLKIMRRRAQRFFIGDPALRVPEAFMEGDLVVEDGTIRDFMEIASRNFHNIELHKLFRVFQYFNPARLGQRNPMRRARRNVAHHYDLSDELYSLFLDRDRQYSCAYFTEDAPELESAQLAKKRHIAAKLKLEPGARVLDIGCGWGGLALYLASVADVDVTGVTLSVEQQKVAEQRAAAAGLSHRVRFRLQDYRDETTMYDRIVSVGMFEHVGRWNYREFFRKVQDLLADDGVMLLHSIGRFDMPSPINPFIRKYIFPGADLPSLSEVMTAVEPLGLLVSDVEILRLHYAETLRQWYDRFLARRDRAAEIYDERFCRMWELYFAICEMGFRHQNLMVFQLQLAKSLDALPLTRDYMVDWERDQAARDGKQKRRAA